MESGQKNIISFVAIQDNKEKVRQLGNAYIIASLYEHGHRLASSDASLSEIRKGAAEHSHQISETTNRLNELKKIQPTLEHLASVIDPRLPEKLASFQEEIRGTLEGLRSDLRTDKEDMTELKSALGQALEKINSSQSKHFVHHRIRGLTYLVHRPTSASTSRNTPAPESGRKAQSSL